MSTFPINIAKTNIVLSKEEGTQIARLLSSDAFRMWFLIYAKQDHFMMKRTVFAKENNFSNNEFFNAFKELLEKKFLLCVNEEKKLYRFAAKGDQKNEELS